MSTSLSYQLVFFVQVLRFLCLCGTSGRVRASTRACGTRCRMKLCLTEVMCGVSWAVNTHRNQRGFGPDLAQNRQLLPMRKTSQGETIVAMRHAHTIIFTIEQTFHALDSCEPNKHRGCVGTCIALSCTLLCKIALSIFFCSVLYRNDLDCTVDFQPHQERQRVR